MTPQQLRALPAALQQAYLRVFDLMNTQTPIASALYMQEKDEARRLIWWLERRTSDLQLDASVLSTLNAAGQCVRQLMLSAQRARGPAS